MHNPRGRKNFHYEGNYPYLGNYRDEDNYILAQGVGTGTFVPGGVAKLKQKPNGYNPTPNAVGAPSSYMVNQPQFY